MADFLILAAMLVCGWFVWRKSSAFWIGRGTGKLLGHLVGGVLGAFAALVLLIAFLPAEPGAGSKAEAPVPKAQAKMTAAVAAPPSAALPTSAPTVQPEVEPKAEDTLPPMNLADARRFARATLNVVEEAHQSLQDAIHLRDRRGITRFVIAPLNTEMRRWPTLLTRHKDDQRHHFGHCHHAALMLHNLAYSVDRQQTVETMKYVRQDEKAFNEAKEQCEKALETSDQAILKAVAEEEAELKRKFGGNECLTVFRLDEKTGEVVPQPKPAHCPKQ